jgi:alkylated DNA repair dioxygenase AlkB
VRQAELFSNTLREVSQIDPTFGSLERIVLERSAWLELGRGWLRGHEALFERLRDRVDWKAESRVMYERRVDVPRLHAVLDPGQASAIDPALETMRAALDQRYRTRFERLSVALYRDGHDSVAWHGDQVARNLPQALVATVSVGAPRRFLIRPADGGASLAFSLGWGDLLVMGGSCQRTHRHAVPKIANAEPRIAIMFRPRWAMR